MVSRFRQKKKNAPDVGSVKRKVRVISCTNLQGCFACNSLALAEIFFYSRREGGRSVCPKSCQIFETRRERSGPKISNISPTSQQQKQQ